MLWEIEVSVVTHLYFLTIGLHLIAFSRNVLPLMLSVDPRGRLAAPWPPAPKPEAVPPSVKVGEGPSKRKKKSIVLWG